MQQCEMSQTRRKSTGNKRNPPQTISKDLNKEVTNEKKNPEKQLSSISAKSTKTTGVPQVTSRQPSIREQLKSKPQTVTGNKHNRDKDNHSPQK